LRAKAFVSAGTQLVLIGRSAESCNAVKDLLGRSVAVLSRDASTEGVAEEAIELCHQHFGGFNGLCHIAGGSGRKFGDGPLHELT
jgi:NADP-dependent 3-hydroxy acid dehydrogenase YdfG